MRNPDCGLLYHCDLSRTGALSHPDIPLAAGQWQVIGRKEPLFVPPEPQGMERPLEDPVISREQLRIRWLTDAQRFEVVPLPRAQRRVDLIDLATGAVQTLSASTLVAPGSCLAIEDRVLLGLEMSQYHGPEEDRCGVVRSPIPSLQLPGVPQPPRPAQKR